MSLKGTFLFVALLSAVLFLGNGCAAFRELFSTPSPSASRTEKVKSSKSKKSGEFQSRRYSRDPLDSLFFTDRRKREEWSKNSNLTDNEKAALRHTLDPDDDTTRREIDRIYRDNERKRKKRQDDIFGPNPFRN